MTRSDLLVNATDIAVWADRREAQELLPVLVRRLILATTQGVERISFRGDEGVQIGGWDGFLQTSSGNAFVPAGDSGWEMGTTKDVKGKADEDYQKRYQDPLELQPNLSTFVFVTPRRWGGKDSWVNEKNKEGIWKDVRAYDADDLATWLEQAPAVHFWLSKKLGKLPDGIEDLDLFWEKWAQVTAPPISPQLMISGRKNEVEQCQAWATGTSKMISLQGDSVEEVIAFLIASLKSCGDSGQRPLSRSLVVKDRGAWDRFLAEAGPPLLLIPTFPERDGLSVAVNRGHHVFLPLGRGEARMKGALELPRLDRDEARVALVEMGIPEKDLYDSVKLARANFKAFRRSIAKYPEELVPAWAKQEYARELLPALMAGRWNDSNPNDMEIIQRLAGCPYQQYRELLVRWSRESDPPIRLIDDKWTIFEKREAWSLLSSFVENHDLENLNSASVAVLAEVDPTYDLEQNQRMFASIHGIRSKYSKPLREGLADTLAVMAATSQEFPLPTRLTGQQWSDKIVNDVLKQITTWQGWASLGQALTLLAEASPDMFLKAVQEDFEHSSPALAGLFSKEDNLWSNSNHYNLLWALECLAWSPDYLNEAATCLAKLTKFDPGGNIANRPINCLREMFLPWYPGTAANTEQRERLLDRLIDKDPEAVWDLLGLLLPKVGQKQPAHPTFKPRYRDWAPENQPERTYAEINQCYTNIVMMFLDHTRQYPHGWVALIEVMDSFQENEFHEALKMLKSYDPSTLAKADRMAIWDALRNRISPHRQYPNAKWALEEEQVRELEIACSHFKPTNIFDKFKWLFVGYPRILEKVSEDDEEHDRKVEKHRIEAIREMIGTEGFDSVLTFVERVEEPTTVALALGKGIHEGVDEIRLLVDTLGSADPQRQNFGLRFICGRLDSKGQEWLDGILKKPDWKQWSPQIRAHVLSFLPFTMESWDLVSQEGAETERLFWSRISILSRGKVSADLRCAFLNKLIQVGRLSSAARYVSFCLHHQPEPIDNEFAMRILSGIALGEDKEGKLKIDQARDSIFRLLKHIEPSDEEEERLLAWLEWTFLPGFPYKQAPKVLYRRLATDPSFFFAMHRAVGEEQVEQTEEQRTNFDRAYTLLSNWKKHSKDTNSCPIDPSKLASWVKETRRLALECGRSKNADKEIGQILSQFPADDDGSWPPEAVREILEDVANHDIDSGFEIGVHKRHGTTIRGFHEGGKQERDLEAYYLNQAQVHTGKYPRTTRILKKLAEHYRSEGAREDVMVDQFEDGLY